MVPKATTSGNTTYMGQMKETDYYLQEAIRNAEELVVLANDFHITPDIDAQKYANIEAAVSEIKARANSLLVAIDPERDQEDADEDDLY